MFIENANLLKKISFPRICLPVIVLLNAGVNFAIILALFLGFLALSGRLPGAALLALVPLLAIQVLFAAGLGMILGCSTCSSATSASCSASACSSGSG